MRWPVSRVGTVPGVPVWLRRVLDDLVDAVNAMAPRPGGPGEALHVTPTGTSRRAVAAASSRLGMARMRISEVGDDTMRCRQVLDAAGTTLGATDVFVAKPWLLRRGTADRDGRDYSWGDAGSGGATRSFVFPGKEDGVVQEAIYPGYVVGDDVLAADVGEAVTGLAWVAWMDLNADGRAWAPAYVETAVCDDDGNTKLAQVVRSAAYDVEGG